MKRIGLLYLPNRMLLALIPPSSHFFFINANKTILHFFFLIRMLHYLKNNTVKLESISFLYANYISLVYFFLLHLLLIPISSNLQPFGRFRLIDRVLHIFWLCSWFFFDHDKDQKDKTNDLCVDIEIFCHLVIKKQYFDKKWKSDEIEQNILKFGLLPWCFFSPQRDTSLPP